MRRHWIAVAVVVCLAEILGGGASAQTYFAGLRGTVRDSYGVVDGAEVQLTDESTDIFYTVKTDGAGRYVFAALVPAEYTVRVAVAGYRPYVQEHIRLSTRAFATLDVSLEVGGLTETVQVTADADSRDMTGGPFSSLLDRERLQQLPTAGRNVFYASTLTPGVIYTGDPQYVRQQDQSNSSLISIGGGPRRTNSYVIDGVPIVDIVNRATFIPSLHAVEEMRVQVGPYDAEVGRTSGGVFNAITRSGSNVWHGDGLYQNRPAATLGRLYFAAKNDVANPHTFYHLFGGSGGGPIVRNRTFFFASTEGYRTLTTRSTVLVLPAAAERAGDFSNSGVTIYDPLTTRPDPSDPARFIRDPFPNNRIPANRLNAAAVAMLQHVPMPTGGTNSPTTAGIVDRADQVTGKLTHKWKDALSTSALYAWYTSQEPDARFYGGDLFENGADPGDGALVRTVHMAAVNTSWLMNDRTTATIRYGLNRFADDDRPSPFNLSTLGFSPSFVDAVPLQKFPGISVDGYGRSGAFLGDRDRDLINYYSDDASGTIARHAGNHVVRGGGEYRIVGARHAAQGGSGHFAFDRAFTSGPDPNSPLLPTGSSLASFLLGYPSSGDIISSVPVDLYTRNWSAFLQDDVRVTDMLSVNLGVRYEYEQGLRERDDRLTVGWASDSPFPIQVAGMRPDGSPLRLTGGVRYAGVDGAPRHQGSPSLTQFGPRIGFAYAMSSASIVRGGYGVFFAPAQGISSSLPRGYSEPTAYVPTRGNPLVPCDGCSLTNPFPSGLSAPVGNALGVLTGVGGGIAFVDPRSRMGRMERYSISVQRLLPHSIDASVGYLGARGRHLSSSVEGLALNINQLDPAYLGLGTALQQPVPNPFYGTPLGVGILAGPTVSRAQLLRPYPQFDSVLMDRPDIGRSIYHAFIASVDRRFNRLWSTHANYTWSWLKDNQFGDGHFFSGGSQIQNNYDVDHEYGLSVQDTPHHINAAAVFEGPCGITRRCRTFLTSGWTIAAVAGYQSGFPISIGQTPNNADLLGNRQRPNVVAGTNPRLSDDYDPSCRCIRWLNPAAWTLASPFTFGDAPRADGRVRTPSRRTFDVSIEKSQRLRRAAVAVRAELINAFNFPDLRGPSTTFGDQRFGQIREAGGFPGCFSYRFALDGKPCQREISGACPASQSHTLSVP